MLNLLDNNTLVLDGTALGDFLLCKQLYGFKHGRKLVHDFNEGLIPSRTSIPLAAGTAIHAALAVRYRLQPNGTATTPATRRKMHLALDKSLRQLSAEWDWRTPKVMHKMIDAYCDHWLSEPFKTLEVEAPFRRIVGDFTVEGKPYRLMWQGRRDMAIQYHRSQNEWIFDHKTASADSAFADVRWGQNPSQLGYLWSRGQLTGKLPRGFIMNTLLWSKPTKKEPDGKFSFSRTPVIVSPHQVARWKTTVLDTARDIITAALADRWPQNGNACYKFGPCPFFRPCVLPDKERERLFSMTSSFVPNTWSPLDEDSE